VYLGHYASWIQIIKVMKVMKVMKVIKPDEDNVAGRAFWGGPLPLSAHCLL
jgi:hypothetical protein